MIRSAALALALSALTLSAAAPAFAQQDAGVEDATPTAKKRGGSRQRRNAAKAQESKAGDAKAAEPKAPPGLQATPVGTYGDWNVFAAGEGKTRICYAIAQPQTRLPKSLKRDAAYLFVTVRKAERVPNEVALMMGFAPKAPASQQTASATGTAPASGSSDPTLAIGAAKYTLVVKETNAWLQNPADETKVVNEMSRGRNVVVKAVSLRGNASTDEYPLTGFGDAIKKAREECK